MSYNQDVCMIQCRMSDLNPWYKLCNFTIWQENTSAWFRLSISESQEDWVWILHSKETPMSCPSDDKVLHISCEAHANCNLICISYTFATHHIPDGSVVLHNTAHIVLLQGGWVFYCDKTNSVLTSWILTNKHPHINPVVNESLKSNPIEYVIIIKCMKIKVEHTSVENKCKLHAVYFRPYSL